MNNIVDNLCEHIIANLLTFSRNEKQWYVHTFNNKQMYVLNLGNKKTKEYIKKTIENEIDNSECEFRFDCKLEVLMMKVILNPLTKTEKNSFYGRFKHGK